MTAPNEPDLLAVRGLAAEPTDESVTRSWYRITQLEAKRTSPSRLRRLVPVMAAVMVALVAAGSLTIMRVGEGRFWPADSTPEAVAALHALATAAENGTLTPIGANQLILTESDSWVGPSPMEHSIRKDWFDPRNGKVVRIVTDGVEIPLKSNVQPVEPELDPGIRRPTQAWLAGLPTDPQQLLVALRTSEGEHDNWTVDHQVWDAMGQLYSNCEIQLTPAQRATFLRALARMTGLTSRETYVDGQRLIAIRHLERDGGQDIYFDPYSGRAVGRGSVFLGEGLDVTYPTAAPSFLPGTIYRAIWIQSVVNPQ